MQEFPPQSAHCRQSSHDGHQLRQIDGNRNSHSVRHGSRTSSWIINRVMTFQQYSLGLQHLYSHEGTREKLAVGGAHSAGHQSQWDVRGWSCGRILVMGVLKQGLGCDFDRLHELVNQHRTVREFLGHGAFSQDDTYEFQTIIDNVYLLTPELLSKIGPVSGGERPRGRKKKAWRAVARAL